MTNFIHAELIKLFKNRLIVSLIAMQIVLTFFATWLFSYLNRSAISFSPKTDSLAFVDTLLWIAWFYIFLFFSLTIFIVWQQAEHRNRSLIRYYLLPYTAERALLGRFWVLYGCLALVWLLLCSMNYWWVEHLLFQWDTRYDLWLLSSERVVFFWRAFLCILVLPLPLYLLFYQISLHYGSLAGNAIIALALLILNGLGSFDWFFLSNTLKAVGISLDTLTSTGENYVYDLNDLLDIFYQNAILAVLLLSLGWLGLRYFPAYDTQS
ncbi:hypothetical protein [Rhodoflexus caldus]|uniref:hypothetical protein n=1 Tax=Rhodoflexus caldus TaxID=2891236 RepID=UPI00202A9068|nr:hypothetical protein [Rhodoflexus caldus]